MLSLFSPAKKRLRGGGIAVYESFRGSSSREGKEPFKLKDNTGTRSTGCKLPANKFRLEMLGQSGSGTAMQAKWEWLSRWDVVHS